MLELRDVVWGVAIAALLTLAVHYRPLWSARSFVEAQCASGFRQAYAGERYRNGELITPDGAGAHQSLLPQVIRNRALSIDAEEINLWGSKARFVLHHVVVNEDGTPSGLQDTVDMHVELERQGSDWSYAHFQVLGGRPAAIDPGDNPFARALADARAED